MAVMIKNNIRIDLQSLSKEAAITLFKEAKVYAQSRWHLDIIDCLFIHECAARKCQRNRSLSWGLKEMKITHKSPKITRLPKAGEIWKSHSEDWPDIVCLIVEHGNYDKHKSRLSATIISSDKENAGLYPRIGRIMTWNAGDKLDLEWFAKIFSFVCDMKDAELILP